MARYTIISNQINVAKSSNLHCLIDIEAPAGQQISITRITCQSEEAGDNPCRIRVFRATADMAPDTAVATIVPKISGSPPAQSTALLTTTSNSTFVSTTDKLMEVAMNQRGMFEWIARDESNVLWSTEGGHIQFGVAGTQGGTGTFGLFRMQVDFSE